MGLLTLLERTPKHPLAEPGEVDRVLEGLSAASVDDALLELTHWFKSLREADSIAVEKRLALVEELDTRGKQYLDAAFAKLYAGAHVRDRTERTREQTLDDCLTALGAAYAQCISEVEKTGKRFRDPDKLPTALARSYRAHFIAAKVRCLVYLPPAPRDWKAIYRPLVFAELAHFDTQPVQIYPREMRTSPRGELAKLLAFYLSAPHDLPPEQIELSAQIIDRIGGAFSWARRPSAECPDAIDLAAGGPPHLVAAAEAPSESRRYFGTGPALKQLAAMEQQSGEYLMGDYDARFAKSFSPTQIVTVMRHVARHLAPDAPHRRAVRIPAAETIEVVRGFSAICQRVTASEFSSVAGEEKKKLSIEAEAIDSLPQAWQLSDRSDWGLGATLPAQAASWPEPGVLLGVRAPREKNWSVAILRRVDSTGANLRCGVQILSHNPISLHLRVLGQEGNEASNWETATGSFQYEYVRAIVLPDAPKAGKRPVILLAGTKFIPKQICEIMMGERSRHIKLAEFLDQGADYTRAAFDWIAPPKR